MTLEFNESELGWAFGFAVFYGPSRLWPLEKHLWFRLALLKWYWNLEFNPTRFVLITRTKEQPQPEPASATDRH
jgi:hypothetical protein